MGYNINYTDLRAFQNTVNLLIEGWKQNLQWVLEDINALVNSDSYRGKAADSMRLYLQDVTGNITITLINILCEYSGKLNQYIQGFYAYDNGWQAVLNEDAMQAVMDTFSHIIQETMDSYDRIKDSMDSVSDQLPSSLLTQQAYVVSMIGERDSIYRLRESVGEYDAAAGTEQPTLQEEVETLLQIIKQQVENPPCSVTGYTAEVWQATDTYGDLERIYNASHWYINSHERLILEAQQSYIDTLDRIQEDLSKERWEKGYELVMVSSASALSLVLSSGLLTTGTLTAETAALSTVAAAFVYSDYIEGVQEMYYGCVGDISSTSVNPLKDTVFGGWEEGYQAAEMLSIGVASYSGMQDIARAEQAAQLEQIYAQKAEQNVIDQTVKFNFDEVDYQKWLERAELGNTGHPGMSREDYIRFQYSDTRVAEQIAYNEVDIDELLKLRQNNGQYAERIGIGGESGSSSKIANKFPNEAMPSDGKVFDYYIENGRIKGIDGRNNVDFVITTDNNLIIGNKHHYLGNGQDVLAAGQLKINGQGQIKRIDNLSGHYRPTVDEAMRYQSLFENLGLDLNKTWLEYYRIDVDSDGMVVNISLDYIKMLGGK